MDAWLTPVAIAGTTTVIVQVIAAILAARGKDKETTVSDSASFRQSLVDREKTLIGEIQSLSDRCSQLEKDLQEANRKIVDLERAKGELELEIKQLLRGNDDDEKTDT